MAFVVKILLSCTLTCSRFLSGLPSVCIALSPTADYVVATHGTEMSSALLPTVCVVAKYEPELSFVFVLRARDNRYTCKRCHEANKSKSKDDRTTSSFNAWDAGVLAKMDDFVSKEFPFVLTKRSAICKTLVNRLADDLLEGKGFSATSNYLQQAYSATYLKLFRSYVSLANRRMNNLEGIFGKSTEKAALFGGIGDPSGFNSSHPSPHYLRDIWNKWFYEIPVMQVRSR